ncbi:type II toxin-antitoxin system RelE/ParE family toxin [Candidatus Peregrinibacteria bacterium]|nr:type II toxin-antitoxin system RelE/ParE family toxin [Candidatus Peregrinibacteria bacterium]
MRIIETTRFRISFEKLQKPTKQKVKKQFQLFFKNIFHPSLHTEKLKPRHKNIWSFRVDKNYRVIFSVSSQDTILLIDIGPHNMYKKIR